MSQQVRTAVHESFGLDLPIVEADPSTLEGVLRTLAEIDGGLDTMRMDALHFVSTVHDGRASARALIDNWLRPTPLSRQDDDASSH